MMVVKELTERNSEDIVSLLLKKCHSFSEVHANLFDNVPLKEQLLNRIDTFFQKNIGYGLFKNNTLNSFLFGFSDIPTLKGKEKGIYIPFWGHYTTNIDGKHFIELYSTLANDLVEKANHTHILSYFPNNLKLQEQLYVLGFGLLVIDAIRPMNPIPIKPLQSHFSLRAMNREDYDEITQIEKKFCSYLKSSPTFLYISNNDHPSPITDYLSESKQTFLIETNEEIVAVIRGVLGGSNFDLLEDPTTLAINYAYTNPNYRGLGLGIHLINEIVNWGRKNNVTRCTVDFESANILANRFWLAHFAPIGFSAIRRIDNRL